MVTRAVVTLVPICLLAASTPPLAAQESLRCTYETRQACADGECNDMESTDVSYLVVPAPGPLRAALRPDSTASVEIRRCDDVECNTIPVEAWLRGGWANLINNHHGYMLRLGKKRHEEADFSAFTEIVSVRLSVLVGHGRCVVTR